MKSTLFWLQCGGCGGDTMSLLSAEAPDLLETLRLLKIEVLWHPSLSALTPTARDEMLERVLNGEQPLDYLCIEGNVVRGPAGTGIFDTIDGKPKKNLVAALAEKARYVLAIGTCASFGGVGADSEIEATGLQHLKHEYGGFLGTGFAAGSGMPVINLPGCPCHPDVVVGTLTSLANTGTVKLTHHNTPAAWYGLLVHQGCTRNEYHEYRVEEQDFGEKGCLFFHMGCHGPLAYGPCNKVLWNRRSSKTRVGVPCFGCTRPDFPQQYAFYHTENIEGIPVQLPHGVDRAHYLAYKGIAAAAAPDRLKQRETHV